MKQKLHLIRILPLFFTMWLPFYPVTALAYVQTDIGRTETESAETPEEETPISMEGLQALAQGTLHLDDSQIETILKLITQETEEETPAMGESPLTPEGNLTLVDDIGTATRSGKQFITVSTKSGHYFYILIDRDAKGQQIVHFLNQVDERDLLALMDEKEATAVKKENAASGSVDLLGQEKESSRTPSTEIPASLPETAPKKQNILLPCFLAAGILAAGAGAGIWYWNRKKQAAPSPEDIDEDLYELPEESVEEQMTESEEEEQMADAEEEEELPDTLEWYAEDDEA